MHTVGTLTSILDEDRDADRIAWSVAYLRERLAEHPATGYRTGAEAVAENRAAAEAAAELASATCEMCGASGAYEPLDKSTWTALADGGVTIRWLCTDRKACTSRRFPELAQMLGDGAR